MNIASANWLNIVFRELCQVNVGYPEDIDTCSTNLSYQVLLSVRLCLFLVYWLEYELIFNKQFLRKYCVMGNCIKFIVDLCLVCFCEWICLYIINARNSQRYCNTEVTFVDFSKSLGKPRQRSSPKREGPKQWNSNGYRNLPNQFVWENIPNLRDQAEKNWYYTWS